MARFAQPRRGEVWLVNLDPAVGHEIHKTRPVVVVTNDVYNRNNWVVLVVPFTTRDQLTAIDRSRMVKRMGKLSPATLLQVDQSLKIVLDLP
jgi:mRNA interferase MazF